MEINVTGDNLKITSALQEYVSSKIEKIQRFFPHITNVHVVLSVDKIQQKAKANMRLSQKEVIAEAESSDMYAAIDDLVDKLEHQVIKHKELLKERRDGE